MSLDSHHREVEGGGSREPIPFWDVVRRVDPFVVEAHDTYTEGAKDHSCRRIPE